MAIAVCNFTLFGFAEKGQRPLISTNTSCGSRAIEKLTSYLFVACSCELFFYLDTT